MNSPERLPSETHKPITGYLWGALAVLTCPCHLPILAIVLAGTTAGAFIGEYWGIAALTLTGLFVLSVTRLLRAFKGVVCGRGRNPTLRLWPTIFSGKIDVFPGDRRSRLISSMTSVAPA
ncbi:broad-spectrum mercury transporter MerE [Pseudomonas sp. PS02302]|uniref:broad-spectrum mercury transporter MerE n=1 Tax=Pseudomonas sp. PS02302 TaxID=2991428 RepID=UPI003FA6D96B